MPDSTKRKFQKLIVVAVLLFSILALMAGIERMEFKPGYLFPFFDFKFPQTSSEAVSQQFAFKSFTNIFSTIFIILLIVLAIVPRLWKSLLKILLRAIAFYIVLFLIIDRLEFMLKPPVESFEKEETTVANELLSTLKIEPSDSFVFLTVFIFVLGGMIIVWEIWKKVRKKDDITPIENIKGRAEEALTQIKSGTDLKNVIIQCYFEMSEILSEQHNIKRSEIMTPREFEKVLSKFSFPREPIGELTRLFEEVRYGRKEAGKEEEKKCIECLSNIIEACKEKHDKI